MYSQSQNFNPSPAEHSLGVCVCGGVYVCVCVGGGYLEPGYALLLQTMLIQISCLLTDLDLHTVKRSCRFYGKYLQMAANFTGAYRFFAVIIKYGRASW